MMLRNRDLNIQQKGGDEKEAAAVPGKRQAEPNHKNAHKGSLGKDGEPVPKKRSAVITGNNSGVTSMLPTLSNVFIDSAKKAETTSNATHKQRAAAIILDKGGRRASAAEQRKHAENGRVLRGSGSGAQVKPSANDDKENRPPAEKPLQNAVKAEVQKQSVDPLPAYDFDQEQKHDLAAVSDFATEIFAYYQAREPFFKVHDYMPRQRFINIEVRAQLANWMVEVQETFELNHETLYLSVKLLDMYLDRVLEVKRESLQLLASTAFFIAAKFDERSPPLIDDFVYLSEDSFDREQLLAMERQMLECVGFDLGAPLSYRFLRRYARVYKADMETLTLGRYVLETSLMFFDFCRTSESLIAVACLLLALRMKRVGDWSAVLEKYSGYTLAEVEPLMWALNHMILQRKAKYSRLDSVYKKYSHRVFHQVALIPSLDQSTSVVSAADIKRFRLSE